jgi:hypothetical protein
MYVAIYDFSSDCQKIRRPMTSANTGPLPCSPVGELVNYHLDQCGRAHDCQAKGRRFKSRPRHLFYRTHSQLWALWVPWEESRGRSELEKNLRKYWSCVQAAQNLMARLRTP